MPSSTRRTFLETCAALAIAPRAHAAAAPDIHFPTAPRDRLAVASYPFRNFMDRPGHAGLKLTDFAAARVFAKTGTIGHGNALSGYATTLRGERLLFSILGNNNNLHAQDANKVIDSICVAMVEELGPAPKTNKRK